MGAPGWDDASPAKFRLTEERRHVTLVWPYYENPRWLLEQMQRLDILLTDNPLLAPHFSLIVADDGSPQHPAEEVLRRCTPGLSFSVRLLRLDVDVRWNWLAARNLAMHHAQGWCLLTDIDHVLPPITLDGLQRALLDEGKFYRLRRTERGEREIHVHPNTFFCHRDLFWRVGGYDERLSGHYGTDGDWRRRAAAAAPVRTLPLYLDRWEHSGDSSTTGYKRKQPEDAGKKALLRARRGVRPWRPLALSFPWHEVQL